MLTPQARDAAWIAARLPHAGRMCLLARVVDCDALGIVCEATSHRDPDNPLRAGNRLGAACAVEYAAQAMALHGAVGLKIGAASRRGLLVAVRELTLSVARLDELASPLRIVARQREASGPVVAYGFEITCGAGTPVATGRATLTRETSAGSGT